MVEALPSEERQKVLSAPCVDRVDKFDPYLLEETWYHRTKCKFSANPGIDRGARTYESSLKSITRRELSNVVSEIIDRRRRGKPDFKHEPGAQFIYVVDEDES